MGFQEMSGPWVETAFWCMDCCEDDGQAVYMTMTEGENEDQTPVLDPQDEDERHPSGL